MIRFLHDERGATAIEYALIAAAIGLVIVAAVGAIGDALDGTFSDAADGLG
jgi:pilus assembly protein Flp/PilA